MAKNKSKTTAIPAPVKRGADGRKYKSRTQRDAEQTRLVLIIAGIFAVVIIVILGGALLIDSVIVPNQAVASVGGQNISSRDFIQRVTFERWRAGSTLGALYQQLGSQYAQQFFSDTSTPYGQEYAEMSSPTTMGQSVLNQMTTELLIKQYAQANNITVSDDDINKQLYQYFNYSPTATTATPTTTPSTTPTALVSATPTSIPSATATLAQTLTPTLTPYPTGIPTATPGATAQKQNFDKNSQDYYTRAETASGMNQDQIRQIFVAAALQQKVEDTVVGKPPDTQDQIRTRHILLKTEDNAKDVLTALQHGESFADLAKADSQDTNTATQGGEVGWFGKGHYPDEADTAIWSDKVKVGDVVGPIQITDGWDVIQIEGHEVRTLSDTEKQQVQATAFTKWLTDLKTTKGVQTFDNVWTDRVPTTPALSDFGVPDGLNQQGGGTNPLAGLDGSGLPTQ